MTFIRNRDIFRKARIVFVDGNYLWENEKFAKLKVTNIIIATLHTRVCANLNSKIHGSFS